MKRMSLVLAAIATCALAAPAEAMTLHNLQVKVGVSAILPDESADISTIGGDVDISDETVPTLALEYFITDHVSAELLCCAARHDVGAVATAAGNVDLGQVTHFPPTLTLKYRWNTENNFQPYVGAGVNYTHFFDEELPAGGIVDRISYDDSVGPAVQLGFDYRLNDHWGINVDARKIWIPSDVTLDVGPTRINAAVDIDPWVVTTAVAYRF